MLDQIQGSFIVGLFSYPFEKEELILSFFYDEILDIKSIYRPLQMLNLKQNC